MQKLEKKLTLVSRLIEFSTHALNHTLHLSVIGLLLGIISALTSFESLTSQSPTAAEVLGILGRVLPAILLGVFLIMVLVSIFVFLFQLHVMKGFSLQHRVAQAFMKALDDSSLNPRRLQKDSNEPKLDPKTVG